VLLWLAPSLVFAVQPATDFQGWLHNVGTAWFALGVVGLLFRTVHLFFLRGPAWGLAWAVKILTDPFHNIAIYWKSPLALLQGQRFDPMETHRHPAET
jgi:hypothetical protein